MTNRIGDVGRVTNELQNILDTFTDQPDTYYKLTIFLKDVDKMVDEGNEKAIALQQQIKDFSRLLDLVRG